jgi:hypothetical protein
MLAAEPGLLVFAFKGGWLKQKLLVYVNLLSPTTRAHVARKRRESRLIRRVSDAQIVRLWTGKIEHQETSNFMVDRLLNPLLASVWSLLKPLIR